jgi:hypothetical protein
MRNPLLSVRDSSRCYIAIDSKSAAAEAAHVVIGASHD